MNRSNPGEDHTRVLSLGCQLLPMLTYWLGQKAPLHAQQMLQILSVYVEMRHKGFFWGGGEREV